jgi:hypothetical protein
MFQTLFKNLKSLEVKIFMPFNIEQQFLFMVQRWVPVGSLKDAYIPVQLIPDIEKVQN